MSHNESLHWCKLTWHFGSTVSMGCMAQLDLLSLPGWLSRPSPPITDRRDVDGTPGCIGNASTTTAILWRWDAKWKRLGGQSAMSGVKKYLYTLCYVQHVTTGRVEVEVSPRMLSWSIAYGCKAELSINSLADSLASCDFNRFSHENWHWTACAAKDIWLSLLLRQYLRSPKIP